MSRARNMARLLGVTSTATARDMTIHHVHAAAVTTTAVVSNTINSLSFPQADGSDNQVLRTDGAGNLAFENISFAEVANTSHLASTGKSIAMSIVFGG